MVKLLLGCAPRTTLTYLYYYNNCVTSVIIYNNVLGEVNCNQVEIYLADKWGIYHPNATWILAYQTPIQTAIHSAKLHKNQVDSSANPLIAWFDADDINSIIKNNENKISQWSDKSGQNNHATQEISALQPEYQNPAINNNPAIYSDGSISKGMGFNMPISVGDDYTIFVVIQGDTDTIDTTTSSNLNAVFAGGVLDNANSYLGINQTRDSVDGANHNQFRTVGNSQGFTMNLSGADIITMSFDQSFLDTYLGKILKEHGASTTTTQTVISGNLFIDSGSTSRSLIGWIGEFLLYKKSLSSAEILEIQTYLSTKWGIL